MSTFRNLSSKHASAVEELLSQAKDLYILEQVAAINLVSFTGSSSLPPDLETRFRRLKSHPAVSRQPGPVSSSKKLLSHSTSMAKKRNFSGRIRRVPNVQSRTFVSSAEQTGVVSGRIKRDSSGNIGSSSWRLSPHGKVLSRPTTTTQPLKLVTKEKSRTSSTDLVSPSSTESDQDHRSNQKKPKSKLSVSWFGKLLPSRAMGCLFFSEHNVIK